VTVLVAEGAGDAPAVGLPAGERRGGYAHLAQRVGLGLAPAAAGGHVEDREHQRARLGAAHGKAVGRADLLNQAKADGEQKRHVGGEEEAAAEPGGAAFEGGQERVLVEERARQRVEVVEGVVAQVRHVLHVGEVALARPVEQVVGLVGPLRGVAQGGKNVADGLFGAVDGPGRDRAFGGPVHRLHRPV
jgi:hypothetical protein